MMWQSYNYDKTGNRQSAGWREVVAQEDCSGAPPGGPCTPLPPTTQWSTDAYTYHAGTHRVFTRTGRQRSYDNAGNLALDAPMGVTPIDPPPGGDTESAAYAGTMQTMENAGGGEQAPPGAAARAFGYNAANRMSGTSLGGEHLISYRHNGRGERVYRQGSDRTVHTVFDDAGRWIGDYDENGVVIQQAIWLGDLPVGLLAKDGGIKRLFHIEADALVSPRAVIDPTRGARGTVVWRWDLAGEAFGNDKPNEDPDGDSIAFVFDMRYPGQQYDSASGLNYNYFRDYDPSTGRYSQSDPIGLNGGISTYGYVGGNPMTNTDPMGLMTWRGTSLTYGASWGAVGVIRQHLQLWSDCVAGSKMYVEVTVSYGGLDKGVDFGRGGASYVGENISFQDENGLMIADPTVFNGSATTIGLSAVPGVGISFECINLGGASTGWGIGVEFGFDISGGIGQGESRVTKSKSHPCGCEY